MDYILLSQPTYTQITNLFKHSNLNTAFRATNTIYKQLSNKVAFNRLNSGGIQKLKCNTCNISYVGQTGRSIVVRHKEHTQYIKKKPVSGYALNILNNKHEYGNREETLTLLKPCNKGTKMNCWESFYVPVLQKQNVLIDEQRVNKPNPLYELAQHAALHNQIHIPNFSLLMTSVLNTLNHS